MFFFKNKFQAPWDIPLAKRVQKLFLAPEKKKVVYLYEKPDSSTFRYRVYNMCQALEKSEKFAGAYFFEDELQDLSRYLDKISCIVFCRTRWSFAFEELIQKAKSQNIFLLFDVDDLVFDIDHVPLVMNTLNIPAKRSHLNHWFSYAALLFQVGKQCHGTIGTNSYIAKKLENVFQKPSYIVNNFLNEEQIQASKKWFLEKLQTKRGSVFKLGYFSGSPSHVNDFAKIAPEIGALLQEFPEICLEVGGYMEFPSSLHSFIKKKRIRHSAFVDFVKLQEKIALADLNLVPLVENDFTHCKSELKFFEAAIVGTTTLATPTFVFANSIDHGKTGFLCKEGDWYSTVKDLYTRPIDFELIQKANRYCLDTYSPSSQLPFIENILHP